MAAGACDVGRKHQGGHVRGASAILSATVLKFAFECLVSSPMILIKIAAYARTHSYCFCDCKVLNIIV